jgi:Na+/melibiose symporter-like transporter
MASYVLDSNETITQRVNRSLFDLLPVTISSFLIVLVALSLMIFNTKLIETFPILTPQILYAVAVALLSLVMLMLLAAWFVYNNNYLLITNLHVIAQVQIGLFTQQTAQLSLSRIQDVKAAGGVSSARCSTWRCRSPNRRRDRKLHFPYRPAPPIFGRPITAVP